MKLKKILNFFKKKIIILINTKSSYDMFKKPTEVLQLEKHLIYMT